MFTFFSLWLTNSIRIKTTWNAFFLDTKEIEIEFSRAIFWDVLILLVLVWRLVCIGFKKKEKLYSEVDKTFIFSESNLGFEPHTLAKYLS